MTELEGQIPLFDLDSEQPDERCEACCKACGQHCTSSKECAELAEVCTGDDCWCAPPAKQKAYRRGQA